MVKSEIIKKYFPDSSEDKMNKFDTLIELYHHWNEKINVISRKDVENLATNHILHSLAISKVLNFRPGTKIMDVGTGGGFPGIPLTILNPDVDFYLIDSIGKKIKVVNEIIAELKLPNAKAEQIRAEQVKDKFDFITGRGVTDLAEFVPWIRNKIAKVQKNALPNGLLYLKGGSFDNDMKMFRGDLDIFPIADYFEEEFFETKAVIYINLSH